MFDRSQRCRTSSQPAPAKMYRFQGQIRRLPVAPLAESVQLLHRFLIPLADEAQRAEVHRAGAAFLASPVAQRVYADLQARAADPAIENWLEEIWDIMYLHHRDPLPVDMNYFLECELHDVPSAPRHDQALLAAEAVAGSLRHALATLDEALEPDSDRQGPMDMSQHARVFGHARIAGRGQDSLTCFAPQARGLPVHHERTTFDPRLGARTITVLRRGHAFVLPITQADGRTLRRDLLSRLRAILSDTWLHAPGALASAGIAAITALPRDQVAAARQLLDQASPSTERLRASIDESLFVVCLDHEGDTARPGLRLQGHIHGYAAGDRWFDKHQLIISPHGNVGFLFEHAPGDGLTTIRWVTAVREHMQGIASRAQSEFPWRDHQLTTHDTSSSSSSNNNNNDHDDAEDDHDVHDEGSSRRRSRLRVGAISSSVQRSVQLGGIARDVAAAREAVARWWRNVGVTAVQLDDLGSDRLKKARCPPDAAWQLAMQVAHWRLNGSLCPTYESCSTARFRRGRTETIRSATPEAVAVARALSPKLAPAWQSSVAQHSAAEIAPLIESAFAVHRDFAARCQEGLGVDRVLLGMRWMAKRAGLDTHPDLQGFLWHPAVLASSRWRLSTSNCGSPATSFFGFGPVVSDGIGVGYFIRPDSLRACVSAYEGSPGDPDAYSFATESERALRDIVECLESARRA